MTRRQARRSDPLNWTQIIAALGAMFTAAIFVVLALWLVLVWWLL